MNVPFRRTLLSAALLATSGVALAAAHSATVGGAEMPASANIVENASRSADHTTLVAALEAAGLVETLQGEGPFTVLAPTDEAFAALPDGTVETLLMPENQQALTDILTCHVIAAEVMASDVIAMIEDDGGAHEIGTLGPCTLTATYEDGKVLFTDENGTSASVTIGDVAQSNGVIHVIDAVLLPKQ